MYKEDVQFAILMLASYRDVRCEGFFTFVFSFSLTRFVSIKWTERKETERDKQKDNKRRSSVDPSVPTILLPRVRILSTLDTLFYSYLLLDCERTKIIKGGPFLDEDTLKRRYR